MRKATRGLEKPSGVHCPSCEIGEKACVHFLGWRLESSPGLFADGDYGYLSKHAQLFRHLYKRVLEYRRASSADRVSLGEPRLQRLVQVTPGGSGRFNLRGYLRNLVGTLTITRGREKCPDHESCDCNSVIEVFWAKDAADAAAVIQKAIKQDISSLSLALRIEPWPDDNDGEDLSDETPWDSRDASKNIGFPCRETGHYGSFPGHDGFDDESGPE